MVDDEQAYNDNESDDNFLIVGIGASAGGLAALQQFFKNVPASSGNAYVVILHLSPDYDSKLVEILSAVAKIEVQKVTGKSKVQPDRIYVVSPNHHLIMNDGHIDVSPNITIEDRRAPIDIFFRMLAESHGSRAVSVLLSGTGANGSMGLKRVKEKGGAVYVQNPREAEFNEMVRNAIETELVDEILPAADIPLQIMSYKRGRGVPKIIALPEVNSEAQQSALRELFIELKLKTGHDFSNYKRATLLRRIERRINIRNLPDVVEYASFVKQNPDETVALLKDLLISVTNFFRDAKAFQTLENEVLPLILQNKNPEDRIRIWVPGCATGEEAYSLAMLLAEKTAAAIGSPKVLIFATDIDDTAIAIARDGYYTINDAADVSPERLQRFFNKEGEGYRVRRELREMILFASHNFLKDPPFSKLDLISCRNVLIYLNATAQERVMQTFHFALKPGRFLFLGSSESVDGAADLYVPYRKEDHIFQSRNISVRNFPIPDSISTIGIVKSSKSEKQPSTANRIGESVNFGEFHRRLLESYAPPSVVLNEQYDIVHMSDNVGKFFEFTGGEPTQNVLRLVKQELRLELRAALHHAAQAQTAVETAGLQVIIDDKPAVVNIHVRPVLRDDSNMDGYMLVLFEQMSDSADKGRVAQILDDPIAKRLEDELVRLKTQLRDSVEQHEFQSEELRASNEELQAMNEELRSAAEELETSKEELQSINEELRTVNQELKVKIEETGINNNNLQNLINSADVGTIFLDRNFQVKLFTPAVKNIFNLISSDYGRPITDITTKMVYPGLLQDAEMVLERLSIVDKEITTVDDRNFMMRLSPYRTTEDRIDGVVITFFDITKRRLAENALRESEARFRTLADAVPQLIWSSDHSGKNVYFNQRWFDYTGLTLDESEGGWSAIIHPDDESMATARWARAFSSGSVFDTEFRLKDAGGVYAWHIVRSIPLKDEKGTITGWFGSATDIEKLKYAEEAQRNITERLNLALQVGKLGSYEHDLVTDQILCNDQHKINYGFHHNEKLSFTDIRKLVVSADVNRFDSEFQNALADKRVYASEYRIRLRSGQIRWVRATGQFILNDGERAVKLVGISLDITDQKIFTDELEKQVKQRTLDLQRSNEDLIQFAHVASHDLKEPVRKIQLFNQRIIDDYQELLPEQGKFYLDRIQLSTTRLFAMINGVLNYSSYSSANDLLEMVNLNHVIEQIKEDLEVVIDTKRAEINFSVLPSIHANETLMYQLFYNLINNSLKFSREGVPPVVSITHDVLKLDGRNYLQIKFTDNGIGFSSEFSEKIFDAFMRLNPRDQYEGTGLGLALCKKIVERHKGTILASGAPNDGTIFTINLPIGNNTSPA